MSVSCEEIHEQITAFVDDRVTEDEYRERIASHIKSCPDCRNAYERELLTKMIVRERFPRATTPEDTRRAISSRIAATTVPPGYRPATEEKSRSNVMLPMLVAVVIGLGVVATVLVLDDDEEDAVSGAESDPRPDATTATAGDAPAMAIREPFNLFNYAESNFNLYLQDVLRPEEEIASTEQASRWLEGQGAIDPEFPGADLDLLGAIATEHSSLTMPHLLYGDPEGTHLYVTAVTYEQLRDGRTVYLTDDVLERLEAGERIWQETVGGDNLVMWSGDERVYVAVADRSQVDMRSILGLPR